MPARAVAQHHVDLAQHERRRAAALVGPVQFRMAHDELGLAQEPVARAGVAAAHTAFPVEPGDVHPALRVAPHLQPRAVDQHLLETQRQRQQRLRCQRGADLAEHQRLASLRIKDAQIAQAQRRHPAAGLHLDRADAQPQPHGPAGRGFDARTPFVDVRQNRPVQRQPGGEQQAPHQQHAEQSQAPCGAQPLPAARQCSFRPRRRW